MKICKSCVQPDTRPGNYFNEEGICGACLWEQEKKTIDWNARINQLKDIALWAKRNSKGNYECAIGVSGGKDSTFQAITARDRLGLRCLLVNGEPDGITKTGKHNIENLKSLGFDVITIRPNPQIMRKLIKRDFFVHCNPQKVTEYTLWSSTYIIADKFKIPLTIHGENTSLTLGLREKGVNIGYDSLDIQSKSTLASGSKEYLEVDGVTEEDLYLYHFDPEALRKKNIRGIWLQYFLKEWSYRGNSEFAKKYGFHERPTNITPESVGTYVPFDQIDSDLIPINQMLKYIKLGFGRCMDHVCYDIREGRISRKEGLDLLRKYDGKCSDYYIKKFCDYIGISMNEFWNVANKFRGPMWIRKSDGQWHNTYWDVVEKEHIE